MEIIKQKKLKKEYKKTLTEKDKLKPCLALVDKERRMKRKALAHIGA